ncbi:uncharacterized protein LOC115878607 isoform X2 [Sitophilus oryzae]|uniref:Uncharacterized protein LOC115878607 isoform X2 n=1 Tax=Sitophilus oryzae TaxID=7048 RepID=A0A6J2XIT3_SITOR|nr:uncharacterized protein LOC115878607 isoform X2 [Sitophilus oryzae]
MEISWKWLSLCLGLVLVGLCNGFPINLEDTNAEHTQFLTGLVAILLTVCSIVFLAGCLCCHRRNGFKEFRNSPVVASVASNLDNGQVNPIANGEFTIFTPLSPPLYNNNVFLANEQVITRTSDDYVYGDIDVSFWFDPSKKDFPRVKLKYIKELGKGWFGKVVEGAAQDLDNGKSWTPVVVRILDAASNARQRVLFLNDASIYLAPEHPNLLALKGRCVGAAPLLLLQEFCSGGDLKARLRSVGAENKVLQWCCEVTSALRHLHDHGLVHHDLASRNCLLTDSLTLKVGDYGLGPTKYPEDYYKGGEPLVPVRWRSPESLECTLTTIQPKKMTTEANVWSLGVVMWEICENGAQPYGEFDDDEVISKVFGIERLRLGKPSKSEMYTDYIFRLIQMCWSNADTRPKVSQIDMMLSDLLQVHRNTQNQIPNATNDFERRWESLKPNTIVKTDNYSVSINIEPGDVNISKPMSPSLNNLHGSLDNLTEVQPMESWLQNVASETRDPNYVKGLSEAIKTLDTALELETISTSSDHSFKQDHNNTNLNVDFKLGPSVFSVIDRLPDSPNQNDSLTDSMIFKQPGSSESETEEENWRKKVERGAYSEKVKLKSRSVADLMVLTHVDYSESESETPLPSLDYRANKSGRKSNLETVSLNFSSEGNLLNVENDFQEELRKLQIERRDSLLFVPDTESRNNSNLSLLHELNSPTKIKPASQVFNVFNVTIDKFSTLRASGSKLSELIGIVEDARSFSRQDSENKSDLGYATLHNSERNSDFGSVDGEQLLEDRIGYIKSEIEERLRNCELTISNPEKSVIVTDSEDETISAKNMIVVKQNLPDILASLDQEHNQNIVDLIESNSLQLNGSNKYVDLEQDGIKDLCKRFIEEESYSILSQINAADNNSLLNKDDSVQKEIDENIQSTLSIEDNLLQSVPKLSDMIRNNTNLVGIFRNIDKQYNQREVVNDREVVHNESQTVPDFCSKNVENVKSSNSVDYNNIEDFLIMKISSGQDVLRKASIASSSSNSSKEQVFSESLVPELKDSFVEGPKIEGLNPPIRKSGNTLQLTDEQVEFNDCDSLSQYSEDGSIDSFSAEILSEATEKEINEEDYVGSENESSKDHDDLVSETDNLDVFVDDVVKENQNDTQQNQSCVDEASRMHNFDEDYYKNHPVSVFLDEERKHAQIDNKAENIYDEIQDCQTSGTVKTEAEIEEISIDSLLNENIDNSKDIEQLSSNNITQHIQKDDETSQENDVEKPKPLSFELNKTFENTNVPNVKPRVAFDLSKDQEETMPNSLTHPSMRTSTPFRKKQEHSLTSQSPYSSINLFDAPQTNQEEIMQFSSNFLPLEPEQADNQNKLNYSLETWDNFLGKSFDSNRGSNENLFDSFSSEPQSMLFIDDAQKGNDVINDEGDTKSDNNTIVKDKTFVKDATFTKDGTFLVEDNKDGTYVMDKTENIEENKKDKEENNWESGGGWFLHPQFQNDKLTGDIEPQASTSKGSYVGFGVDDEIMAAIRNELLEKLPHAQGASQEAAKEEELDQTERNEVFLRYNVYNNPLSPIPEESFEENEDDQPTPEATPPKLEETDSDWSDQGDPDGPQMLSSQTNESPLRVPNHRHTPSQDSCCSNDTLFNLEDFVCANEKDTTPDKDSENLLKLENITFKVDEESSGTKDNQTLCADVVDETGEVKSLEDNTVSKDVSEPTLIVESLDGNTVVQTEISSPNQVSTSEFLDSERNHTSSIDGLLPFGTKQVAPLPSPEDNPWKSLPASLLTFEKITNLPEKAESLSESLEDTSPEILNTPKGNMTEEGNTTSDKTDVTSDRDKIDDATYENIDNFVESNNTEVDLYMNVPASSSITDAVYENIENPADIINEADYVNLINLENEENRKNNEISYESKDFEDSFDQKDRLVIENGDHDIFGVLTDIRFNGPLDNQLMSTSFSESNEVDEQDWDSGSDTRSSSSGEFIWKEGEHEESLKALRAAPHDMLDDIKPMEEITEETSGSDVSSDDDGETPEFVPSAWDKYATPTKSALRSPEKSLERSDYKKPRGVWFKKQKYHCVYEYPREPESPILQSQDLWKPQPDFAAISDWEFDAETYLPPPTGDSDIIPSTFTFKPKINNSRRSLYFLTNIDGQGASHSGTSEDFMVSSSTNPFDINPLCSQFFPGSSNWIGNVTPDSGLEDLTPGSVSDTSELSASYQEQGKQIQPLRKLAAVAVKLNKQQEENKASKDALGGLRHTRNKLKLDLPPSPSAFTTSKSFSIEPSPEPIVLREKPTFSTFGKSRFMVQQVDTPTECIVNQQKNVCFDVLPYKPLVIPLELKDEIIYEPLKENFDETTRFCSKKDVFSKGEASLLDSADEDSGIESSTLERKVNNEAAKEHNLKLQ